MKKNGFALVYAILIVVFIFGIGITISLLTLQTLKNNDDFHLKNQCFYLAETGISFAFKELEKNPLWDSGISDTVVFDFSNKIIGYFNVIIDTSATPLNKIISIGKISDITDTVIVFYNAEKGNAEMFNNLLFSDTFCSVYDSGSLKNGRIHSNSNLDTSLNITYSNIEFSSPIFGSDNIQMINYDSSAYRTMALSEFHFYNSDLEFRENNFYNGRVWYIDGNVFIGGRRWWDFNYKNRFKLQIRNLNTNGVTLPAGYSVNIQIDTASMIKNGMLRSDLKDLRIVRYSGGIYTEIDRVYFDRNDLKGIWFSTQEAIPPGGTIDNYYIYYNYAGVVTNELNDFDNVFLFYDTFFINPFPGKLHKGRFLDLHGGGVGEMNHDNINKRLYFDAEDNEDIGLRTKNISQQNVLIQADIGVNLTYPVSGTLALATKWNNKFDNALGHISNGSYNSPQIGTDGTRNSNIADTPGNFYFPADGSVHTFKFASGESRRWWFVSWSDYFFWVDNILRISGIDINLKSADVGDAVIEFAQQRGRLDNLLIRKFISPEPEVITVKEGNSNITGTICATGKVYIIGEQTNIIDNFYDTYPSILAQKNIKTLNSTDTSSKVISKINGIVYSNENVNLTGVELVGSIYAKNIFLSGFMNLEYDTDIFKNPFLNPPPFFDIPVNSVKRILWKNF